MKTLTIGLIAAIACAAALPAQSKTVIYPRDHVNREGSSYNSYYHITAGICRIQHVYEAWNLDLPKGAMITSIGYRQDGSYALATIKVQFEAFMGHNSLTMETVTSTFDLNYDATPTNVIAKKIFDLPAFPKGSLPSSNFCMLKLDKQFAFQMGKNLVTEVKVYNNSNSNKNFNYPIDHASYYSPSASFGLACKTSGNTMPTITSGTAVLQGTWRISLSKFPASMPTVLILGASRDLIFGSIPLPVKLDGLGMPGCYQNIDMNFVTTGPTTNTGGSSSVSFNVPLNFKLVGQKIYAQMWAPDVFANKAGLVTSNGVQVQFGAYPRETLIYRTGSTTSTTGYVSRNYGTVTRFDYQ